MRHGSEYAYRKGCRCEDCRAAQSRRSRNRRYEFRDNGVELIRGAPVWSHLDHLHASGMPNGAIADCAGIPIRTLWTLNARRSNTVQRRTAEAILGVTPDDKPDYIRCKVSATAARTLLVTMLGAGVSWRDLEDTFRISNPHRITNSSRNVYLITHKRVVLAYRYLATKGIVPASLLEEVEA
jgi:hypothetical protein